MSVLVLGRGQKARSEVRVSSSRRHNVLVGSERLEEELH